MIDLLFIALHDEWATWPGALIRQKAECQPDANVAPRYELRYLCILLFLNTCACRLNLAAETPRPITLARSDTTACRAFACILGLTCAAPAALCLRLR